MKKSIFLITILSLIIVGCAKKTPATQKTSINNKPDKIKLMDIPSQEQEPAINQAPVQTSTSTPTTTDELTDTEQPQNTITEDQLDQVTQAILKTNFGDIKVEFYQQDSPQTVMNFVKLAYNKFYDGVKFHRVIKDFMIQTGDPNSKDSDWSDDGRGGPGYTFADEFNQHKLVQGSLAMANSGPDTNGSQFFIVTAPETPWLDGKHTNFGYVVEGLDVVMKIQNVEVQEMFNGVRVDHPVDDVVIESVELITEKKQTKS